MSKEDMVRARELIKARRFDEAREVLEATSHHQAEAWLKKLDEIDPPNLDPEATLIEKTPVFEKRELPPPMASPEDRQEEKAGDEGEIPLPLAFGLIGLVLLVGLVIIVLIYINSNVEDKVVENSEAEAQAEPQPDIDPASVSGARPISYGASDDGSLNEANGFTEIWVFNATTGDEIVIEMRSETVDSQLFLYGGGGEFLAEDDDSGEGRSGFDALIEYTITENGQYFIFGRQWFDLDTPGPYTLSLERD
jgi:hypothetical protein